MNTPILLSRATSGTIATQEAARSIDRMIVAHRLKYHGSTVSYRDIVAAGLLHDDTEVGNNLHNEAWERMADGLYLVGEVEYRIREDREGVFLVPTI